jgi:DNA-binding CsgD family transcriptional regulator
MTRKITYGVLMGLSLLAFQVLKSQFYFEKIGLEIYFTIIAGFFLLTGLYLGSRYFVKSKSQKNQISINSFTKREKEIANALVDGLSNKEIAESLFISENTVKTHLQNLFSKLNVTSRMQALKKLLESEIKDHSKV